MTAPVLVVAHEATRTGSPRVLLELLRYAVPRCDHPVAVRLLSGGPLASDLLGAASAPDLGDETVGVLVNGSLAAEAALLAGDGRPVAIYVHEEGEALRSLMPSACAALVARADVVWSVSERSRRDLVDLGVDASRVQVVPPVVSPRRSTAAEIEEVRRRLGLGATGRLVLGCGEAGWRKGADLFVQVAARLAGDPSLRFAWVGRQVRSFQRVLDHDTSALGLDGRIVWSDEVDEPGPYLAAADLLVMTSREDPQPLVPLEAAMLGTATVGFGHGGMADLAADGAAVVAPYPDVAALTESCRSTLVDPVVRGELVARGVHRVETRQSIDVVGDRFVALLRDLARGVRGEVR